MGDAQRRAAVAECPSEEDFLPPKPPLHFDFVLTVLRLYGIILNRIPSHSTRSRFSGFFYTRTRNEKKSEDPDNPYPATLLAYILELAPGSDFEPNPDPD